MLSDQFDDHMFRQQEARKKLRGEALPESPQADLWGGEEVEAREPDESSLRNEVRGMGLRVAQ